MATATRPKTAREPRYAHPVTGAALISIQAVVEDTQKSYALTEYASNVAVESTLANSGRLLKVGVDKYLPEALAQARTDRRRRANLGKYAHEVIAALVAWRTAGDITAEQVRPEMPDSLEGFTVDGLTAGEFTDQVVAGFERWVVDFDVEFLASGIHVANLTLGIAGTIDLVARLRAIGTTATVEITTSSYIQQASEKLAGLRSCHTPLGTEATIPAGRMGVVLQLRPEFPDGYGSHEIERPEQNRARRAFRRALGRYNDLKATPTKPGRVLVAPGKTPALVLLDGHGYEKVPGILAKADGLTTLADVVALGSEGCAAVDQIGPERMKIVERMLEDYGLAFAA